MLINFIIKHPSLMRSARSEQITEILRSRHVAAAIITQIHDQFVDSCSFELIKNGVYLILHQILIYKKIKRQIPHFIAADISNPMSDDWREAKRRTVQGDGHFSPIR